MTAELGKFLKEYVSTGKKDENGKTIFTHTSLGDPKASYCIPPEKRATLHHLIAKSHVERRPVYLTERPQPVKPITIDIDLKYPAEYTTRQHDERHIKELLKLYSEALITFVDLPKDKEIDAYVFQRKDPYYSNGNMKDGIHIMYPDICISTDIQHLIRSEVLKRINQFNDNPEIGCLPLKNSNNDVIDLSVIASTGWMMYGCMKPGCKPYKLTCIYRLDNSGEQMQFQEMQTGTTTLEEIETLINHLSTYNVTEDRTYAIRPEMASTLEEYLNKSSQKKKYKSTNFAKKAIVNIGNEEDQIAIRQEAEALVELLADWRAEDYKHWIDVGLCLHNISPALHETWIKFSKRSESFNPETDPERWYSFAERTDGLSIGTLHRWARQDNPRKYKEVQSTLLQPLIERSVTGATQDVAMVIYKMYCHRYVCLDAKGQRWAEFSGHRWKINEGMSLKKKIGDAVQNEYLKLVSHYTIAAGEATGEKNDDLLHKAQALLAITFKLRDITFKDKVMRECVIMFYDSGFQETLNSNPYLIGLDNGIYDLSKGEFRAGTPEDRISFTTGNDYPDIDESLIDIESETSDIPQIQAIYDFMKQVFPRDATRRFMFICLASHLEGYNREELFFLWTGVGGNGKSKLLALFEMAFGEYCFKLPINLLTNKRSQPGAPTPELMRSLGRRLGSFQEPDEGALMNTGLMKEFTGNDKMYIRGMYAEGGEMKPMFTSILLCNAKPKMSSDDEGTWRRMVVIDFIAKFVAGTPKGKYEYARNVHLDQMFPDWAPYFLALLCMYHKIYKVEGLKIPQEVKDATYDYRKQSDAYAMFMDEYFHPEEGSVIKLDDAYVMFKEWYSSEYNERAPPRREFKAYVERKLSQQYGIGRKAGWSGYVLRHPDSQAPAESEP